jgi:hypothetical protein
MNRSQNWPAAYVLASTVVLWLNGHKMAMRQSAGPPEVRRPDRLTLDTDPESADIFIMELNAAKSGMSRLGSV